MTAGDAAARLVCAYADLTAHIKTRHAPGHPTPGFDPLCHTCRDLQEDIGDARIEAFNGTLNRYALDNAENTRYAEQLAVWDAESGYRRAGAR